MSYRTHPLYKLAREASGQPINWDNPPELTRLQQEMRLDYMEKMETFNLIDIVVDKEEQADWMETLNDIIAQPEQKLTYDEALGGGRN
jgi:hypothetical protein